MDLQYSKEITMKTNRYHRTFHITLIALFTQCPVLAMQENDDIVVRIPRKILIQPDISTSTCLRIVGTSGSLTGVYLTFKGISDLCSTESPRHDNETVTQPHEHRLLKGILKTGTGLLITGISILTILKSDQN